jgi:23S rRNA pseudouridine1911/1915/1917 synthase
MTLIAVKLETGRTHQIRVHLAEAGHPVVGDRLYGRVPPKGGGGLLAVESACARRMERQALHAAILGFSHPITGVWVRHVSRPPADMQGLISQVFGEAGEAEMVSFLERTALI